MDSIRRRAERNKQDPTLPLGLLVVMALFMLLSVGMCILVTYHIHALGETPMKLSGTLEEIYFTGGIGDLYLKLQIAGSDRYFIRSDLFNRTYGLLDDRKLGDIYRTLDPQVGSECQAEYVRDLNGYLIVRFSVNGIEYLDKDTAVKDHQAMDRVYRVFWGVAFFVCLIQCVLAWKGFIH